jgi:hypothetical protein
MNLLDKTDPRYRVLPDELTWEKLNTVFNRLNDPSGDPEAAGVLACLQTACLYAYAEMMEALEEGYGYNNNSYIQTMKELAEITAEEFSPSDWLEDEEEA